MPSLKEVKRRINSIRSTQKITSAMQMVSSAKLHRAQTALGNMLPYEERLHFILSAFVHEQAYLLTHSKPGTFHPLRQSPFAMERPVQHVAIVVVASDTGLCGAYNANMAKFLNTVLEEYAHLPKENILLYPVGKKMVDAAAKTGCAVSHQFEDLDGKPEYIPCASLSRRLGISFLRGNLDKVELLYYHFKNMAVQQIKREQFLPFPIANITDENPSFGRELRGKQGVIIPKAYTMLAKENEFSDYIIEPSRQQFLDELLPKVMRFRLFRAMLDANASEHAARTMAMKTATENADDLLADLTVLYNKSRQQAITNELLDIAGGSVQ